MSLSAQQEVFCHNIAKGMSGHDAYRAAGYKTTNDNATNANASRLLTNAKIAARVAELRANAAKETEFTVARFAKRLDRIASAAERTLFRGQQDDDAEEAQGSGEVLLVDAKGAADIARQCTMDAAKLLGLIVEKRDVTNRTANDASELSREDLLAIARAGSKGAVAPGRGEGIADRLH